MINISGINSFHVSSIANALSDHDVQYLVLYNVFTKFQCAIPLLRRRLFTADMVHDFSTELSYETWDNIYLYGNIDYNFNSFFKHFLRLFESCFPM